MAGKKKLIRLPALLLALCLALLLTGAVAFAAGTTEISVSVSLWEDEDNAYETRPESVRIVLTVNGEDSQTAVELTEAGGWSHTFRDLPKYDGEGKEIVYGVREEEPFDYEASVGGDAAAGFVITNTFVPVEIPDEPVPLGVNNKVANLPRTGGAADPMLWIASGTAALAALVVLMLVRRKKVGN